MYQRAQNAHLQFGEVPFAMYKQKTMTGGRFSLQAHADICSKRQKAASPVLLLR